MSMILHIGNYNYSSWSLRPWLVLKKAELPFTVKVIDLDIPGYKEKLSALSSSATVPVLEVHTAIGRLRMPFTPPPLHALKVMACHAQHVPTLISLN